jgi:hypothetical protein
VDTNVGEFLDALRGMVGKRVVDRKGTVGTVVQWHEYAGYCIIRLANGDEVRRYTAWVRLV